MQQLLSLWPSVLHLTEIWMRQPVCSKCDPNSSPRWAWSVRWDNRIFGKDEKMNRYENQKHNPTIKIATHIISANSSRIHIIHVTGFCERCILCIRQLFLFFSATEHGKFIKRSKNLLNSSVIVARRLQMTNQCLIWFVYTCLFHQV
jgi:hypothetical protein